jgi:RNA polymerase sigma-70 factor (ECF subfamily)
MYTTQLDMTMDTTPACIEDLFRSYYPAVYRLALAILNDSQEAEDIAQETFLRAGPALGSFRQECNPKTWLFSITANLCRSQIRKHRAHRALETALKSIQALFSGGRDPEETLLQVEQEDLLVESVRRLDEKHRIPLLLFYVEDMPAEEIAQALQVNLGTVHSRLHYARRQLLNQIQTGGPIQRKAQEVGS